MTADRKRSAVRHVRCALRVSERRACTVLGYARSMIRFAPKRVHADDALVKRLHELSEAHPRLGYRKITAKLRRGVGGEQEARDAPLAHPWTWHPPKGHPNASEGQVGAWGRFATGLPRRMTCGRSILCMTRCVMVTDPHCHGRVQQGCARHDSCKKHQSARRHERLGAPHDPVRSTQAPAER